MNEKPILFSGPMVRAILAGSKTQTRRVVKPQPFHGIPSGDTIEDEGVIYRCHHGKTGDRLWVKETYSAHGAFGSGGRITYRADLGDDAPEPHGLNWKPSIFCTRKASRITLEITAVRVQRLQEISEHDAEAEGCSHDFLHSDTCSNDNCALCGGVDDCDGVVVSAKENYRALWERINGKGSWDANPWVWVIEFKRI